MGRGRAVLFGLGLGACAAPEGGPAVPERCQLTAWYREDGKRDRAGSPELIGSWNGWRRPGLRGWDRRGDFYVTSLPLPPGVYHYGILVGDELLLDSKNPQSAFLPSPLLLGDGPFGTEVSRAVLPDCSLPALAMGPAVPGPAALSFSADFAPGEAGDALDEGSLQAELRRGEEQLAPPRVRVQAGATAGQALLSLSIGGLAPGKYTLALRAHDRRGRPAAPVSASAFVTAGSADGSATPPLADGLVYQVIVDRFLGPGPLPPPRTPGARAGGTLDGVRGAILAGYFERLGVTTLWLSPLYANAPGELAGRDGRPYEAYHGYWPAAPRSVEPRLGGEAHLRGLVAAAHSRGLRVIVDAVPNHVHDSHPYYKDRSRRAPAVAQAKDPAAASWFHDGPTACVCGAPGCGWGERLEDCWFDRYLPDLNWRNDEVQGAGVADLLFWLERFDLDGLRIDAVPMMPRAATRRMVRAIRGAVRRDGLDLLLLGETYTGPGAWGRAEIRAFLGQRFDGLDSQFDFPLMWALRAVLAQGKQGFAVLEEEIDASERAFAGSGAAMGHILGNHDTTRFVSEAAGDAGGDPWRNPPAQPTREEPYRRQLLGLALILSLPGLPVLYYGDEVGLAGAGDPDCRRPMPDEKTLSAPQLQLLLQTGRLGRLRRCLPALRRGVRRPVYVAAHEDVALLSAPADDPSGGAAIVALSKSDGAARQIVRGLPPGAYKDALSGRGLVVTADGAAEIEFAPLTAAFYIPATSPCLAQP